jgi:hypothetical protein
MQKRQLVGIPPDPTTWKSLEGRSSDRYCSDRVTVRPQMRFRYVHSDTYKMASDVTDAFVAPLSVLAGFIIIQYIITDTRKKGVEIRGVTIGAKVFEAVLKVMDTSLLAGSKANNPKKDCAAARGGRIGDSLRSISPQINLPTD